MRTAIRTVAAALLSIASGLAWSMKGLGEGDVPAVGPLQSFYQLTNSSNSSFWLMHRGTGKVSYCQFAYFTSGLPDGTCTVIGNVPTSAEGYTFTTSTQGLPGFYAVSASTGSIWQCSAVGNGNAVKGGCKEVSNLSLLQ